MTFVTIIFVLAYQNLKETFAFCAHLIPKNRQGDYKVKRLDPETGDGRPARFLDAEESLEKDLLEEAKKQLEQADIVIDEIKNETIATKKLLLESDAYEAKKDLGIRFERALATFRSKERQIFLEIKQQIILLVLQRTIIRAQETFGPKERATALINDTINKLEGDLL